MSVVVAKRELRPAVPRGADVGLVRVAPDGRRFAFSRNDGPDAGIWVDDAGSATRVVAYEGWRAEELAWSPDGERLAYLVGGGPPPGGGRRVGFCSARAAGELGRVDGMAFAWMPTGAALVCADIAKRRVVRHAVDGSGKTHELCGLDDDGDPQLPPRIAPAPDGSHVAFTCRRVDDELSELWVLGRKGDGPDASLLTQIPGSGVHVLPFWSPKGTTLAMLVVHLEQEKSAIIAVPRLEGEGVVLYESALLDGAETPAWSPTGSTIAFLHVRAPSHEFTKSGPAQLALLHVREKSPVVELVTEPDEITGQPHFVDDKTLAIDGGAVGWVLTFADPV